MISVKTFPKRGLNIGTYLILTKTAEMAESGQFYRKLSKSVIFMVFRKYPISARPFINSPKAQALMSEMTVSHGAVPCKTVFSNRNWVGSVQKNSTKTLFTGFH